jgi:hypothetical protein
MPIAGAAVEIVMATVVSGVIVAVPMAVSERRAVRVRAPAAVLIVAEMMLVLAVASSDLMGTRRRTGQNQRAGKKPRQDYCL